MIKTLLVTGSSGLVGSAVVRHFAARDVVVHGVDNNMRENFFGPDGDTRWNQARLERDIGSFTHHEVDVRSFSDLNDLISSLKPEAVVHAAGQPSHDRASGIPLIDFEVNALGTLNLLEVCRRHVPDSPFVFLSTNKVYGDSPNLVPVQEHETRWEFEPPFLGAGVNESMSIDQSLHSLFGASKASADLYVQEYGRYFGMPTVALRGGCLTGSDHSGVELHGFLSYLVKCNVTQSDYKVFGYKGKQVRDNISSSDVASFVEEYVLSPRPGVVYNIGGGFANSISILEAIAATEERTGIAMNVDFVEENRVGDHRVYYSDLSKLKADFPKWSIRSGLDEVLDELVEGWTRRLSGSRND